MQQPIDELMIEQIANAVVQKIGISVPFQHRLWSTKEIAGYLVRSEKVVRERVVNLPDFPQPTRPPVSAKNDGHPRWLAIEVVQWATGYKQKPSRKRT